VTTEAEAPRDVEPEDDGPDGSAARPPLPRSQVVFRSVIFATFLAAVLAGAFVGIHSRERDDAFVERQFAPRLMSKSDVEKTMRRTLEPTPDVRCTPGDGGGMLRNDWRCRVRYPGSQRDLPLRLHFQVDGRYEATGVRRSFTGCCVPVPIVKGN
jgi:hypothetical protein